MKAFHAHLYYNEDTYESAIKIIEKAKSLHYVSVGTAHKKPVGPHPVWSCQFLFKTSDLNVMIPWLLKNHEGLTFFIHGLSGDDLKDHTDYVMWIGKKYKLNLSIFE
jgi:DOPA 4,5-dioxygenase